MEAENPVLHAGGGILLAQASEELAALAEFLDIPVSRTLAGQGCLSDLHPLMIGQTGFWGLEFTHSLTTTADVILGLGTRFGEAMRSGAAIFPPRTAAGPKPMVARPEEWWMVPGMVMSNPQWAEVAKAYGVEAIRCASAEEFLPALEKAIAANKAGRPFLVEAPMENIVVPTPGCWNINDIYSPKSKNIGKKRD